MSSIEEQQEEVSMCVRHFEERIRTALARWLRGELAMPGLMLEGPPGTGKSYILRTLRRVLGKRVQWIDSWEIDQPKRCREYFQQLYRTDRRPNIILCMDGLDRFSTGSQETILWYLECTGVPWIASFLHVDRITTKFMHRATRISLTPWSPEALAHLLKEEAPNLAASQRRAVADMALGNVQQALYLGHLWSLVPAHVLRTTIGLPLDDWMMQTLQSGNMGLFRSFFRSRTEADLLMVLLRLILRLGVAETAPLLVDCTQHVFRGQRATEQLLELWTQVAAHVRKDVGEGQDRKIELSHELLEAFREPGAGEREDV